MDETRGASSGPTGARRPVTGVLLRPSKSRNGAGIGIKLQDGPDGLQLVWRWQRADQEQSGDTGPAAFSMPVEARTVDGQGATLVAVAGELPDWMREALAGHFDLTMQTWPVDLLVFAAAGHDVRGLRAGQLVHRDGAPFNCNATNLAYPDDLAGTAIELARLGALAELPYLGDFRSPLPRTRDGNGPLDALVSLIVQEGGPLLEGFTHFSTDADAVTSARLDAMVGYGARVGAALLERYAAITIDRLLVASPRLDRHDRFDPHHEARIEVSCIKHDGSHDTFTAIAGGPSVDQAIVFALVEGLRQALFFGRPVAYTGVLARKERVVVRLEAVDLWAGAYQLVFDVGPPAQDRGDEREFELPEGCYVMDARVEWPAVVDGVPRGRTPYVRLLGQVPAAIRKRYGHLFNFKKKSRRWLHRLVPCIGGMPTDYFDRDMRPQLEAHLMAQIHPEREPGLWGEGHRHVHHDNGLGLMNQDWSLRVIGARRHARLHIDWRRVLEQDEPYMSRKLHPLVQRELGWRACSAGELAMLMKGLHTISFLQDMPGVREMASISRPRGRPDAGRDAARSGAGTPRTSAAQKPRAESARRRKLIIKVLHDHGGVLPFAELLRLTKIPRASLERWLQELVLEGSIIRRKLPTDRRVGVVELVQPDLPARLPMPRRPRQSRTSEARHHRK